MFFLVDCPEAPTGAMSTYQYLSLEGRYSGIDSSASYEHLCALQVAYSQSVQSITPTTEQRKAEEPPQPKQMPTRWAAFPESPPRKKSRPTPPAERPPSHLVEEETEAQLKNLIKT